MVAPPNLSTTAPRRWVRAAAVIVSSALAITACGGDNGANDQATTTVAADDGAETTTDDGGETTTTSDPTPVITEPPASEFEPVYGGKIVVGIEAETGSPWRPETATCDSSCHVRARTFFDALVVVDDDLEARPFLLESIEANEDFTLFTLTVRDGITFHDGTALDADVVMDNINRSFSGLIVSGTVKDIARDAEGNVLMDKLDDMTFTIATGFNGDPDEPLPWPLFPHYLGFQAGLIASSEWLAAVDAGTASETEPVGSGPFILTSFVPGDRLTVVRNENYWLTDENGNQLPYLDEIEFRVIPDPQVAAQALRSGDLDMLSTSSSIVVEDLSNDPNFRFASQEQLSDTNYLLLNLTKPYLADRDVRCALTWAIDRDDLNDVVMGGAARPSISPFTPGQEGYLPDLEGQPYDPDAARDVIAAWEAENGPIQINISATPITTNLVTAQYLEAVWGDIGVDVSINQVEQSTLITNALFGDEAFDVFAWRNHAGLWVDNQYRWWHGFSATPPPGLALNFGRLDDPVINELLEAARAELDPEVRRGYAEDINRRFVDQCFIIPTFQARWGVAFDPIVQNIGRTPFPDGDGFLRDGAGFPGQVHFHAVFVTN